MKNLLKTLVFLSIFLIPVATNAAQIMADTEVYTPKEKTYTENVYILAGKTVIESPIDDDLIIVGGEVDINSQVFGDVLILGGKINFNGNVGGDVRIIGGESRIFGEVLGDLVIVGGKIFLEESYLAGDVILIGGETNVNSDLNKNTKIVSGNVKLDSSISGPIEITTQNLYLGDNAVINDNLSYYSPRPLYQSATTEIVGEITFNQIKDIRDTSAVKQLVLNVTSFWLLLKFISNIVIAFVLVYVFKVFTTEITLLSLKSFWKSLLFGVLTFFLAPIVVGLLFLSLAGIPIGFLLILTLIFISIILPSITGIYLGVWLRKFISKQDEYFVDFQSAAFGVVLLTLFDFVPVIGDFARFVLILVAIGSVIRYLYRIIVK